MHSRHYNVLKAPTTFKWCGDGTISIKLAASEKLVKVYGRIDYWAPTAAPMPVKFIPSPEGALVFLENLGIGTWHMVAEIDRVCGMVTERVKIKFHVGIAPKCSDTCCSQPLPYPYPQEYCSKPKKSKKKKCKKDKCCGRGECGCQDEPLHVPYPKD